METMKAMNVSDDVIKQVQIKAEVTILTIKTTG